MMGRRPPPPSMGEPAASRRHHTAGRARAWAPRHLGEDALQFGRWFFKSKFALMQSFLGELRDDPGERDEREIEDRFVRATRHAQRVQTARAVVTVLLALGVVATAVASFAKSVAVPALFAGDVAFWTTLVARVAQIAGSVSVLLLLARLAFDRYLGQVETTATFLAMQIAASSGRAAARAAGAGRRSA